MLEQIPAAPPYVVEPDPTAWPYGTSLSTTATWTRAEASPCNRRGRASCRYLSTAPGHAVLATGGEHHVVRAGAGRLTGGCVSFYDQTGASACGKTNLVMLVPTIAAVVRRPVMGVHVLIGCCPTRLDVLSVPGQVLTVTGTKTT